MAKRRLHPSKALAATCLALMLIALLPAEAASAVAAWPRAALLAVAAPLATPLKLPADRLRAVVSPGADRKAEGLRRDVLERELDVTRLENRRLRAEIGRLRERLERLTRTMRLADPTRVRPLPAPVAGVERSSSTRALALGRGARHGLGPGQVVVAGAQLVGRLTSVSALNATVTLVTSPGTQLELELIRPPGADAPPAGEPIRVSAAARADGSFEVLDAVAQQPVEPGDEAVLIDPRWPPEAAGFRVGRVTLAEPDPHQPLTLRVRIRPQRDPERMMSVSVLRRLDGDFAPETPGDAPGPAQAPAPERGPAQP
jgi:cell shape-determining protein MreC